MEPVLSLLLVFSSFLRSPTDGTRPLSIACVFQFPEVPYRWNPAGSQLVKDEGGVHNSSFCITKKSVEQGS